MAKIVDATEGYSPLENSDRGKEQELTPKEQAEKELTFSKNVSIAEIQKNLGNAIDKDDVSMDELKDSDKIDDIVDSVSDKTKKMLEDVNDQLKRNAPRAITKNIYELGGKFAIDRIMDNTANGFASAEIGATNLKNIEDSEQTILRQFEKERTANENILKRQATLATPLEKFNKTVDIAPRWLQSTTLVGGSAGVGFLVGGPLGLLAGAGLGYAAKKWRKKIEKKQRSHQEEKGEVYMNISDELRTALENKLAILKDSAKDIKEEGEAQRQAAEDLILAKMDLAENDPKEQTELIEALMSIQSGEKSKDHVKKFYPGASAQEKVHMYEAVKQIPWLSDRASVKRNLEQAKAQADSVRASAEKQEEKFLGKFEGANFEMKDFEAVQNLQAAPLVGGGDKVAVFDTIRPSDKEVTQNDLINSMRSDLTFASKKDDLKAALSADDIQGLLGVAESTHLLYTLNYLFSEPGLLLLLSPTTKQKMLTWLQKEDEKYRASEVGAEEGTYLQREYWNDIEGDNGLLKEGGKLFSEMKAENFDENFVKTFDEKMNKIPDLERKHGAILEKCLKKGKTEIKKENLNQDIAKSLDDAEQVKLIEKLEEVAAIFEKKEGGKLFDLKAKWTEWKELKEGGKTFSQYQKEIGDQTDELKKAEKAYERAPAMDRGVANPEKPLLRGAAEDAKTALDELVGKRAILVSKLTGDESIEKRTNEIAEFFNVTAPGIKFHKGLELKDGAVTAVPFFKRIHANLFKEFEHETEDKILKVWEQNDPLKTITSLQKRAGAVKVNMIDKADSMYELRFPSDLGASEEKELNITSNTTDKVVELENNDLLVRIASPCVNKGTEGGKLDLVKNAIVYTKAADGKLTDARHAIVSNITLTA